MYTLHLLQHANWCCLHSCLWWTFEEVFPNFESPKTVGGQLCLLSSRLCKWASVKVICACDPCLDLFERHSTFASKTEPVLTNVHHSCSLVILCLISVSCFFTVLVKINVCMGDLNTGTFFRVSNACRCMHLRNAQNGKSVQWTMGWLPTTTGILKYAT